MQNNPKILLFTIIAIIILVSQSEGGLWAVEERVSNGLGSKMDLQIHCKSKEKDLGVHVIPNGGLYEFQIDLNFLGTTLFFCGFVWDNKLHWFDIYIEKRDKLDCSLFCWWIIKEDGPCKVYVITPKQHFFEDSVTYKCYKWNKQLV